MLTAILDCLVQSELECLVAALRRDGIVCLAADTPLDTLHDQLEKHAADPIVVYGPASLDVPYDDCPRLWLGCGPDPHVHDTEQALLRGPVTDQDMERRAKALRSDYELVSYVEALSFMANAVAKTCVNSMGLGEQAADILLRHARKPTF